MHTRFMLLVILAALACSPGDADIGTGLPDLPQGVEAISLDGDTLRPSPLSDDLQRDRGLRFEEARQAFEANPADADALIWLGRRTAYLGRYREAVTIYTEGIRQHPDDARMFRHRGHRYITLRLLDLAVTDLERGASLIEGRADEVEPDGLPNVRNTPTSTLHSNIWYHLGLAHYLSGELDNALQAYRECLEVSNNPDMLVATTYWLYMTLRRLGRDDDARAALEPISDDMDIIENQAYHQLLQLFGGGRTPESLLDTSAEADVPLANATVGYGIGNWHFINGREEEAVAMWQRVLEGDAWAAFGYIAAEAELARR